MLDLSPGPPCVPVLPPPGSEQPALWSHSSLQPQLCQAPRHEAPSPLCYSRTVCRAKFLPLHTSPLVHASTLDSGHCTLCPPLPLDTAPPAPPPPSSQQSHLQGGRAKLHLSPKHFSPSLLQDAGPAPNLPGQVQRPVPKSPSVPLKGPSVCYPVSLLPRGPHTWKLQPQAEAGTQIPGWASDEQSASCNQETGLQSRLALN